MMASNFQQKIRYPLTYGQNLRRKRQKNGITPAALRSFVPILQSVLLSDLKVPSIDVLTGLSRPGMDKKNFLVTFTFYMY